MKQSPEWSALCLTLHPFTLLRKRKDKKKVILRYHIALFFGRKNIFLPSIPKKELRKTFIYNVKSLSL